MSRLAGDTSGNVLAIAAVSLVPLLAMIGGAIDVSRLYMAHTRLQQACDAGALAGRKAMANIKTLSDDEKKKAGEFFDFNFPTSTYGAQNLSRSYAKGGDGVVVGAASIDMPTAIMKIFGYRTVPLNVTCESTLNIPNTDVMFVLDVTGSMSETPSGDSVNKITGLKNAVKDFYALLGPGAPSGPGRIRYGFMPYSSNVNVGNILLRLDRNLVVGGNGSETWQYQSRSPVETLGDWQAAASGSPSGPTYPEPNNYTWSAWDTAPSAPSGYQLQYTKASSCDGKSAPPTGFQIDGGSGLQNVGTTATYPNSEQTINYRTTTTGKIFAYRYQWYSRSGSNSPGICQLERKVASFKSGDPLIATQPVTWSRPVSFRWDYKQVDYDLASLVANGSASNPAYYGGSATSDVNGRAPNSNYWWASNKTNSEATSSTLTWDGCIEEADTVDSITASSSLSVPSDAYDLKIDLIPTDTQTRWKPFLPQLQYDRDTGRGYGNWIGRDNGDLNACPREASELKQYATDYVAAVGTTKAYSPSFNLYVNSLQPGGYTYHDIGLIWGARFLSADGIFRATNADSVSPGGYQVNRHLVFMTDGALNTPYNNSDPWGYNPLDQRLLPSTAMTTARSTESHRRRIQIICNAMKSKKFTVWVIGFGVSDLPDELKKCATDDDHWSVATDSDELRSQFAKIAQAVGGLRLSS